MTDRANIRRGALLATAAAGLGVLIAPRYSSATLADTIREISSIIRASHLELPSEIPYELETGISHLLMEKLHLEKPFSLSLQFDRVQVKSEVIAGGLFYRYPNAFVPLQLNISQGTLKIGECIFDLSSGKETSQAMEAISTLRQGLKSLRGVSGVHEDFRIIIDGPHTLLEDRSFQGFIELTNMRNGMTWIIEHKGLTAEGEVNILGLGEKPERVRASLEQAINNGQLMGVDRGDYRLLFCQTEDS